MKTKKEWTVYILVCSDGSLYTGITKDIEKRLEAHQKGIASKYTRARLPVRLAYLVKTTNKSRALKRELQIKKLSRQDKLVLINEPSIKESARHK